MTTINELVHKINQESIECKYEPYPPASKEERDTLCKQFKENFNFDLPPAYLEVLTLSDGLKFNGLTLWPSKKYSDFRESLIDVNLDMREMFNEDYLYFAQRDDVLFVYDQINQEYIATAYTGDPWKKFTNAEEMLKFVMERALI